MILLARNCPTKLEQPIVFTQSSGGEAGAITITQAENLRVPYRVECKVLYRVLHTTWTFHLIILYLCLYLYLSISVQYKYIKITSSNILLPTPKHRINDPHLRELPQFALPLFNFRGRTLPGRQRTRTYRCTPKCTYSVLRTFLIGSHILVGPRQMTWVAAFRVILRWR